MRTAIRQDDPKGMLHGRSYRFLVPLTLVIAGAGLLMSGFEMASVRTWLESTGVWAPILFVFLAIASMSMVLPKTAVSISAGFLFGTQTGFAIMLLVATIAAALNFAIGHWWLHDSILRRSEQDERNPTLKAIRSVGKEAGFGFHFLVRLAPVPTMVISYTMGAIGAKKTPFLAAAMAGAIPQVLWVHCGSVMRTLGDSAQSSARLISGVVALVAGVLIAVIVPRMVVARIKQERSSKSRS